MWIVKPLGQSTTSDRARYNEMIQHLQARGSDIPLSQTLSWAQAASVVGTSAWMVFNPLDLIGGIVFFSQDTPVSTLAECSNGPFFPADELAKLPEHLARFTNALLMGSKKECEVHLRPRLLEKLPVDFALPIFQSSRAATWMLDLKNVGSVNDLFSARLKRTLKKSRVHILNVSFTAFDEASIREFYKGQKIFYDAKDIPLPEFAWWRELIKNSNDPDQPKFWHLTVTIGPPHLQSTCHLMLAQWNQKFLYLFGHDNRPAHFPSQLSAQALAHAFAIEKALELQIHFYDFNGHGLEIGPDDPYYGVNQFKQQFLGQAVVYHCPHFIFQ